MSAPRVVHCKKEPFDVYVGRPSKWGNPFSSIQDKKTLAEFIVPTREESITRYEQWLLTQPELMSALHELKGKTLACWCAPKQCHADVLLRLANQEKSD